MTHQKKNNEISKMHSIRLSNFELLRLISMFMVLIVHANFQALGSPTSMDLHTSPVVSISRILLQSFALVCVNVFVLISGWFGIHFSFKGICQLLFQTFFFLFGIYFVCLTVGFESLSTKSFGKCIMLDHATWFVKSYLCLYILAPVLNSFVEYTPQKDFKKVLVLFYLFQFVWGWGSKGVSFFEEGFSTLSFVGLYLLARYIRLYKPTFSLRFKKYDMVLYVVLSLLTAAFLGISIFKNFSFYYKFWSYNSPLIIFSALYLLLYFSKLNFTNNLINKIAKSCFAVYLFHFIIWKRIMIPHIHYITNEYNLYISILLVAAILIVFYIIAIGMDRIRIHLWNLLLRRFVIFNDKHTN